jgi:hypothetical protein
MPEKRLIATLEELKGELENAGSEPSQTRLRSIIDGVESRLSDPHDPDHFQSLIEDIENQIIELEVSHPKITSILSSIIESLNAMGI